MRTSWGNGVTKLAETSPERFLEARKYHEMTFACSQAVLSGSGVVGDERCQRRVRALYETGQATISHASRAITDVLEQTRRRVWK